MNAATRTLVNHLRPLIDAQPEWGWYLALAWNAQLDVRRQESPLSLAPWLQLAALADATPDALRLSDAIAASAATSTSVLARESLLFHAGVLLPPPWATALDDLQGSAVPRVGVTARFVDLVVTDLRRAERRVESAQDGGLASRFAADFLYAAVIACSDSDVPVPPGIARDQARLESTDGAVVDAPARYSGRLRLAARADYEAAAQLAEEAAHEVGADEIHTGLWSVVARCPEPRMIVQRLVNALPRTPTPEVVLSLLGRCGAAQPGEVEASARSLATSLTQGAVDGRRGWPAAWRLLGAGAAVAAPAAVDSILSLGPPAWAVELSTWRELRSAPRRLRDELCAFQAETAETDHPEGPLEAPPPPPWAWLPGEIFAARLRVLSDPDVPIPSGYAWEAALP